ncbi:MAG: hypothetical protein KJ052_06720 [Candidatus Hydrogenedentes bacterium]|nr:hypothetical protein [Candidatus Hydrogenedentota bacterium]
MTHKIWNRDSTRLLLGAGFVAAIGLTTGLALWISSPRAAAADKPDTNMHRASRNLPEGYERFAVTDIQFSPYIDVKSTDTE